MDTLLAFFIGLGTGIIYYFVDYRKLIGSYKSWYKLTHKNGLPKGVEQGFVYAQPFSGKLYSAIFLAIIITGVLILTGSANILVQIMYGLFIALGLMVAFYVAPLIFRHAPGKISKVKQQLDRIDELESKLKSERPAEPTKRTESLNKIDQEPKEKGNNHKKDDDWRKGIKDYLNE